MGWWCFVLVAWRDVSDVGWLGGCYGGADGCGAEGWGDWWWGGGVGEGGCGGFLLGFSFWRNVPFLGFVSLSIE